MTVPQRTCIGCFQVKAKKDLIRIVRSPVDGNIAVDLRGKEKGRGAYICPSVDCISKGIQPEKLNRALKIDNNSAGPITSEIIDKLKKDLLILLNSCHH